MVDTDISSVESSHSSTREYSMQRARGKVPTLQDVSAQTVFRFVAKKYFEPRNKDAEDNNPDQGPDGDNGKPLKRKKKNRFCGAWRAFLHERLAGRPLSKELIQELSRQYKALSHDEYQEYYELGLASSLNVGTVGVASNKSQGQGHSLALVLESPNADCATLVASPFLSMVDYDEFCFALRDQRRKRNQELKDHQHDMDLKHQKQVPNEQLLKELAKNGPALSHSIAPATKAFESCPLELYTWKPCAAKFAQDSC